MAFDIVPASGGKQLSVRRPLRTSNLVFFLMSALLNGMRWVAGPGTGKTRGIALTTVWPHLWQRLPSIVIDPTGALCNYVLYKVLLYPEEIQRQLWQRIRYVDMAATDFIQPLPLYVQRGEETLFAVANRFVQVIARLDPSLSEASIEGLNSIKEVGGYGGMLMAALGLQVTDLAHLLAHPEAWTARLEAASRTHPDVQPAVAFFEHYAKLKPDLQQRKAGSLGVKLLPFLVDPLLKVTFASRGPGIDWEAEMRQGKTVLLDFGGVLDRDHRLFKLVWCFLEIVEYLKRRGIAGRQHQVLFVMDEISSMLFERSGKESILGQDLHDLCTVWARNVGVKLCFAHQYPSQLEPTISRAFAQLGTQVIGNIQDPDDALYLARQFHYYDPYLVKKEIPTWMAWGGYQPQVIDYTTVEFTPEEQFLMAADAIRRLPKFHFLVRPALGEGNLTGALRQVSQARLDAGLYPDEELVAEVRRQLRKRDGYPVDQLLADVEQRLHEAITVTPVKPVNGDAILKGDTTHDTPHPLPATKRRKKQRRRAKRPEQATGGDSAWQESLWQDPS